MATDGLRISAISGSCRQCSGCHLFLPIARLIFVIIHTFRLQIGAASELLRYFLAFRNWEKSVNHVIYICIPSTIFSYIRIFIGVQVSHSFFFESWIRFAELSILESNMSHTVEPKDGLTALHRSAFPDDFIFGTATASYQVLIYYLHSILARFQMACYRCLL